jgi:hypothetical protein
VASYANVGAALNAAVSDVNAAGGGEVVLMPGTWSLPNPGTLVVPKTGVKVRGMGIGVTVIETARTDYIFKTTGTSQVTDFSVEDMTIDCQNGTNVSALQLLYMTRCGARRVYFKNGAKWFMKIGNEPSGLSGYMNEDCFVDDCVFDGHSSIYEMLLVYNSRNTWIRNNKFLENASNSPTIGIWQQCDTTHIQGNYFKNISKSGVYYGITCNRTYIEDNTFDNVGSGIVGGNVSDNGLMGTTYITDLRINYNRFLGGSNTTSGFAVQFGAVDGCYATGNYVSNYERGFIFGYGNPTTIGGVDVTADFPSKNGSTTRNTFKNINPSGTSPTIHNALVFSSGGGSGIQFIGNKVIDDQGTPTNTYPISFNTSGASYTNMQFIDNDLSAAAGGASVKVNDSTTVSSSVVWYNNHNFTNPTGGITAGTIKSMKGFYMRDGNLTVGAETINSNTNFQVGDGMTLT